jgi:protein subunit release factor B
MPDFGVSRQKEQALRKKMDELGVREQDLEEKFIRSRGPGGQHVNKVATCVYLKHVPTGHSVKVGRERSQALNRYLARRQLVQKIEEERLGRLSEEQQRREKIRRQKRKRSKRAKEKILRDKKLQSAKKQLRAPPTADE